MAKPSYPMRVVSERTGLSPHVIRVWERRYKAIEPERTASNRRLYAEDEVQRLELLATLTRGGHAIRQLAGLPLDELRSLAAKLSESAVLKTARISMPAAKNELNELLEKSWQCIVELDSQGLYEVLDEATLSVGISAVTQKLIIPLIGKTGSAWESGTISIAEEHAASAVIKEYLIVNSRPYAESAGAPCLVVATPPGQLHDLGALLVTNLARRMGWKVSHLGPALPAEEIARVAVRSEALAVALSIVYPSDDPQMPCELRRLRRFLPAGTALLVGGRSASAYHEAIREIGASLITDLTSLTDELEKIRSTRLVSVL